jgi:hypothetical protein
MASITGFITTRLKLKVNAAKSAVAAGRDRTFLGFSFYSWPTTETATRRQDVGPVSSTTGR